MQDQVLFQGFALQPILEIHAVEYIGIGYAALDMDCGHSLVGTLRLFVFIHHRFGGRNALGTESDGITFVSDNNTVLLRQALGKGEGDIACPVAVDLLGTLVLRSRRRIRRRILHQAVVDIRPFPVLLIVDGIRIDYRHGRAVPQAELLGELFPKAFIFPLDADFPLCYRL